MLEKEKKRRRGEGVTNDASDNESDAEEHSRKKSRTTRDQVITVINKCLGRYLCNLSLSTDVCILWVNISPTSLVY